MANNIYIGLSKTKNIYVETAKVKKIYRGTEMIWQSAIPVARPTSAQLNPVVNYDGNSHTNGFSITGVEYVSGDTSGSELGYYVAYYRPDSEHVWEDTGSREQVTVTMTIEVTTNCLSFTANTAGSTFNLHGTGGMFGPTPRLSHSFQYSFDRINWTTLEFLSGSENVVTLQNVGDTAWVRGINPDGVSESRYSVGYNIRFQTTGSLSVNGNIMGLIDNGVCGTLTIPHLYCFTYLFADCESITTPPALPATVLTEGCYDSMFNDCTNLVSAPALPATTLAEYCYRGMFSMCYSLTTAPALPATTLAAHCYHGMFTSCLSLTTAPALPATTLAEYCYRGMFSGCGLTVPPVLPATTLAECCYLAMFQLCANLVSAPALPATTLAEDCYSNMFSMCYSLTTAPALPATTLAEGCYERMFSHCSSLATPPALPATTLATNCYTEMFYSYNYSTMTLEVWDSIGIGHTNAWRIPSSGYISTLPSTYGTSAFSHCAGTRSSDNMIIDTEVGFKTYYTQNAPV